jgi:hypothetical protein
LPRERIAAHQYLLVGAVGVQENEPERVAGVEVPDLVEVETVKERAARRLLAEETDTGRSCGPAVCGGRGAPVGLGEESLFDR